MHSGQLPTRSLSRFCSMKRLGALLLPQYGMPDCGFQDKSCKMPVMLLSITLQTSQETNAIIIILEGSKDHVPEL